MFGFFKKKQKRQGFTDILLTNQFVTATEQTAQAAESSAIEIAAGLVRRSLWNTEIMGTGLIDQQMLAYIGNDLVRYGNSIWGMGEGGRYLRSYSYDITGSYNPESWRYRLTFAAPSKTGVDMTFSSEDVLHFKQNATIQRPWIGISPIQAALPVGEIVSKMEQSLSKEAGTTTGHLLPIPKDGAEEEISALKTQIQNLNGKLAVVESARSFSEDPRTAPREDWAQKRLGMEFDNSTSQIYKEALISTLGVLGIPYELLRGEGTSQREALRRFLNTTLKPIGRIIQYEFKMKTGIDLKLDYSPLAASDVAGRARAYKSLVSSGMSEEAALKIIGIDNPMSTMSSM